MRIDGPVIYRNDALDRQRTLAAKIAFALTAVAGVCTALVELIGHGGVGAPTAVAAIAAAASFFLRSGAHGDWRAQATLGALLMLQVSAVLADRKSVV